MGREYDVRLKVEEEITSIRVTDSSDCYHHIDTITRGNAPNTIRLNDTDDSKYMTVRSVEQLDNLIIGLQKAKELGWVL